MGLMRLLLTAPLAAPWLLFAKLCATALLSVLQALAFVVVAALPRHRAAAARRWPGCTRCLALTGSALMLGALGAAAGRSISKQLENFAGTMNFVIFPMYFLSTALLPAVEAAGVGREWVWRSSQLNPFTHAVEWIRFALYGKDPGHRAVCRAGHAGGGFSLACRATTRGAGFGG
jgi:ABC-2 type transport system permease protein